MDTMASMMLTRSWLQFTDMLLLAMCVVTCTQTSNTDVLDAEASSRCAAY
jgi:hypothetical protein